MVENFGQSFARVVPTVPESSLHPHVAAERAELFSSFNASGAELEALTLLNALVYLYKPRSALETGTGSGYGSAAIASAMAANGLGTLHTVDVDAAASARARENVATLDPDLVDRVSFAVARSLDLIDAWEGDAFDFVFFDSLIEFRHLELERLMDRGLLAPGAVCAFHDTSRRRGESYSWNPEMILALDRYSRGNQWLECDLSRGLRVLRVA